MADSKMQRKPSQKAKQSEPEEKNGTGQAAAAAKNRRREMRLRIIRSLQLLGIPLRDWPEFVHAYFTNPDERLEFHYCMSPPMFQAPAFDRLNQSPEAWARQADDAWRRHRDDFLETCEFWVTAGVDERIGKARLPRGTGQKTGSQAVDRKRGSNTPVDRRYDWAARYLAREPLKEIAAAEGADPSTVGRNARETLRMAGWKAQRKSTKCY